MSIKHNGVGSASIVIHTKTQGHWSFGFAEDKFREFYLICAWQPFRLFDLDHIFMLSVSHQMDAPYQLWLQITLWLLRKISVRIYWWQYNMWDLSWKVKSQHWSLVLTFTCIKSYCLNVSNWFGFDGVVLDCIDSWSLHPYLLRQLSKMTFQEYSNMY